MRKIVSVILLLGFVLSLFACTSEQQTTGAPTSTVKAVTPTITPTPVYDTYVVNRARLFAAALTTNDQDLATRLIEFPLTVVSQDGSVLIKNGEEFKKVYSTLANSDFLLAFGQPGKGNTLSSRLAGGLSLSEGDFAIVINNTGMVKEVHNLTVTKAAIESALVATQINPPTVEECYKEASTVDEKLTCVRLDLETSKNTLQALMIEIQPIVEDNQEYLQTFRIDYDQIGATLRVQSEWETYVQEQCDWEASVALEDADSQLVKLRCLVHNYGQRINDLRINLCEGAGMTGECEASLFYKQGDGLQNNLALPKSSSSIFTRLPSLSSAEKVEFYSFNRARLFITAIVTNDKDTIYKMIQYPLKISTYGGSIVINDQHQLKKYYDAVFDQSFTEALLYTFKLKNPIRKHGTELEIYSSDYFVDVNVSGMVVSISNYSAKLENVDPTPTIEPTRTLNPNDCRDTAMGTYDMNMCFGSIYLARVQKLKNLVNELGLVQIAVEQKQFLQAEKAWETYSSDFCDWFDGFWLGGSIRGVMASTCLINQYDQRINNLRMFLCEDHGLSGECEASLRYKPKE